MSSGYMRDMEGGAVEHFEKIPLVSESKKSVPAKTSSVLDLQHGVYMDSNSFGISTFNDLLEGKNPLDSILRKLESGNDLETACHLLHENELYYPAELLLRSTRQFAAADAYKKIVYKDIYKLQPLPENISQDKVEHLIALRQRRNIENWERTLKQSLNILASYDPLILKHADKFELIGRDGVGGRAEKKSFHKVVGWVAKRIEDNMTVFVNTHELKASDEIAAVYFSYILTGQRDAAHKYLDGFMKNWFDGENILAWEKDYFRSRLTEWYRRNAGDPHAAKSVSKYIENFRVLREKEIYDLTETEAQSSLIIERVLKLVGSKRY